MTMTTVCRVPAPDGLWHMRPLATDEAELAYPLLLAVDRTAEPLPAWCARIAGWLCPHPEPSPPRGVMTLRSATGVIVSLILYMRAPFAPLDATLVVELLRTIEPVDGRHGLTATLRMAELTARAHGCGGILLQAEPPGSAAWNHTTLGMAQLARAAGYERIGENWLADLARRHDTRSPAA